LQNKGGTITTRKPVKSIGGQAVIEGVMIKSPKKIAVACRTPKGKIVYRTFPGKSLTQKKILGWPIIRGFVAVGELMVIGFKALSWSADQQTSEEEKITGWHMALTFLISIVIGVGLFVALPYWLSLFVAEKNSVLFNLIDGVFRLALFLGYVVAIGFMPDIKRLYQYHGAEHKAVHCYEAKKPLTVKNVQKYPTAHPRCGTSLIVFVIALSIILFSLIKFDAWYWNLLTRVIVLPLIAGLSYEALKATAKVVKIKWLSWLTLPGIWVQKITTQEPDNKQVEVAIAAVKKAL